MLGYWAPERRWRWGLAVMLYKLAPRAAAVDRRLFELLVIVDAIRGGRAHEWEDDIRELRQRLKQYA